jgi:CheY-like chemotaxis protein
MPSVVPRRIALIEDDADARCAMRRLLELEGHSVQDAESGPAGVDLVLASRPDLALIDLGLPGLDGYQVAQVIRAAAGGGDVFLIALTGYGQPEDRRRALAAGFNAHLVKPTTLADIRRVLAEAKLPVSDRRFGT